MDSRARDLSSSLRRRGALITTLFALLWGMVGASGIDQGALASRIVAVVVTALAVAAALRPAAPGAERVRSLPDNWQRHVGIVNLAQFAAIGVVVAVFVLVGLPQLVPPLVCLLVGIHFFPLARLFDQPEYRPLGAVLCLFAVAGIVLLAVGAGAEASRAVTGFGAAAALWAVSLRLGLARRSTRIHAATGVGQQRDREHD